MILQSVKLSNIRSYTSEEVKFPQGSVLLSGDIGSGKSSVLLAVEFALFGIGRGILSGESLLRSGKNEGYVELKFLLEKKSVVIRRTLKRQKSGVAQSSGYILLDGVKQEGTAVELKSIILDLLGYPKEMLTKKSLVYRYTVYTPQEDMKLILFDDSDERVNTLRKIFGVDKYKRVKENVEIYLRFLREEQNALSERVSDLDIKLRERDDKKKLANDLSDSLNKIDPSLVSLKSEIAKKQDLLKSFESSVKELSDLRKKVELCELSLSEKVSQRLKNNGQILGLQAEVAELNKKIKLIKVPSIPVSESDLESSIKKKEEKLSKFIESGLSSKEKISAVRENLASLEKEVSEKIVLCKDLPLLTNKKNEALALLDGKENLSRKIDAAEKNFSNVLLDVKECEIKIDASTSLKGKVSKLENCPTCLQPVSINHKKLISDQEESKIKKLKERLNILSDNKIKADYELRILKEKMDVILKKENELERLSAEIKSCELLNDEVILKRKRIADLRKMEEDLKSKLVDDGLIVELRVELENQKNTLKKVIDARSLEKEKEYLVALSDDKSKLIIQIEEFQSDLKKHVGELNVKKRFLQDKISSFGNIERDFEKEKVSFEELRSEEKRLEIDRASLLRDFENVSKLIESLDCEINSRLRFKDDVDYIKRLRQWLGDYFVSLVGLIERHVMVNVHSEFDDLFKSWFDMLIEDDNLSIRLDDSFRPVVVQNGFDTDLGNLSGGEKTSAALAYRLSLNKVVNDLMGSVKTKDLIILDEPTDGFSSEQLDKVRLVLDELNVKQVVLVSHEAKVESFVDSVIRIAKNEHVSRVIS